MINFLKLIIFNTFLFRFTKQVDKVKKIPAIQERLADHASSVEFFARKTGMKPDNVYLLNLLFEAQVCRIFIMVTSF